MLFIITSSAWSKVTTQHTFCLPLNRKHLWLRSIETLAQINDRASLYIDSYRRLSRYDSDSRYHHVLRLEKNYEQRTRVTPVSSSLRRYTDIFRGGIRRRSNLLPRNKKLRLDVRSVLSKKAHAAIWSWLWNSRMSDRRMFQKGLHAGAFQLQEL